MTKHTILMEGSLNMKDPFDKKRILSRTEWRVRKCALYTNLNNEIMMSVYKDSIKNPKLLMTFPITSSIAVTSTNTLDEYTFTIDAGLQYVFASNSRSTRDKWVSELDACINKLQSKTTAQEDVNTEAVSYNDVTVQETKNESNSTNIITVSNQVIKSDSKDSVAQVVNSTESKNESNSTNITTVSNQVIKLDSIDSIVQVVNSTDSSNLDTTYKKSIWDRNSFIESDPVDNISESIDESASVCTNTVDISSVMHSTHDDNTMSQSSTSSSPDMLRSSSAPLWMTMTKVTSQDFDTTPSRTNPNPTSLSKKKKKSSHRSKSEGKGDMGIHTGEKDMLYDSAYKQVGKFSKSPTFSPFDTTEKMMNPNQPDRDTKKMREDQEDGGGYLNYEYMQYLEGIRTQQIEVINQLTLSEYSLVEENSVLKKELQVAHARLNDLEAAERYDSKHGDTNAMATTLSMLGDNTRGTDNVLRYFSTSHRAGGNTYDELYNEVSVLQLEIKKLKDQKLDSDMKRKQANDKVATIMESVDSLEKEKDRLRKQLLKESVNFEDLNLQLEECHKLIDDTKREKMEVEKELQAFKSRFLNEFNSEVANETERLALLEEKCNQLTNEVETLTNANNVLTLQNIQYETENTQIKSQLDALLKDIEVENMQILIARKRHLEQEKGQVDEKLSDVMKDLHTVQNELNSERIMCIRYQKELGECRTSLQNREAYHQKIHDDDSEKIRNATYNAMKLVNLL